MSKAENRKSIIIIAVCICIAALIPVSQRARSYRLSQQIEDVRVDIVARSEKKNSLMATVAKMNTVEGILALGSENNLNLKQINSSGSMVASN